MVPPAPRASAVPESFGAVAKRLLTGAGGDGDDAASKVAARAVEAVERLTQHLAELVGETGVRAVLARSVALSAAAFPWLATTIPIIRPPDAAWESLRAAMAKQDPRRIREAFGVLLSTFVGLLGRLIGDGLVAHLLHDIWPEVFPSAVKETT
jgi:hypothetical protein